MVFFSPGWAGGVPQLCCEHLPSTNFESTEELGDGKNFFFKHVIERGVEGVGSHWDGELSFKNTSFSQKNLELFPMAYPPHVKFYQKLG